MSRSATRPKSTNSTSDVKNRSSISAVEDESKCSTCSKFVGDNDNGVECEMCRNWCHAKCAGINDQQYKLIGHVKCFKFFCPTCIPKVDRLLTLENRMDELQARFEELSVRMSNFSNFPTFPPSSKPNFLHAAHPHQPDRQQFNEAVTEAVELKLKRNNAVLFGLPESGDDLLTIRKIITDYPAQNPVEQIQPSEIVYTFRDGPIQTGRPRFNKVVCATNQVRENFIKLINKVVKNETDLKVRARPDLTFRQRQDGRTLREKLEQLPDCDEYFINYSKRSIFSRSSRKCVFSLDAKVT